MFGKDEREKLEDAFEERMREFSRTEEILDNDYYQFEKESRDLLDFVTDAFRFLPTNEALPYIYEMEDSLDDYKKIYNSRMDDLLEARNKEKKSFYQKMDHLDKKQYGL